MKRILIVDDYADARHILRESLEMKGYACREAEDGCEALEAMRTEHFDLVITDNEMPVMTGLQFLQGLTQAPEDQRRPVIFLTGNLSDGLCKAAVRAGASAILKKPYAHEELIAEITRILQT